MPESTYQRLTRTRTGHFSVAVARRVSLWLGSDHLLRVEQSGFTETYKRFYFRDIQAITIMETSRRTIWNEVLAVPLVICLTGLAVCAFPVPNTDAMIAWSLAAMVFLLPLVVNNLRGTACACQLRTAVQTEDIDSLCRVRQTRKVLERIRPLIVAAQGQLAPDEVSLRMQGIASGESAAPKPEPPPPGAPPILS